MRTARIAAAVALLGACLVLAGTGSASSLLAAAVAGLLLRALLWRGIARSLGPALPVLVFAGLLALMQWLAATPLTTLPLKTVAVFALSTVAFHIVPWGQLVFAARHGSFLYQAALFALFVRHFVLIFGSETQRVLQARALSFPRQLAPGSLRSLRAALLALLSRSVTRAERFYAAQRLRGFAE